MSLTNGIYTMTSLADKYQNFMTPAYKIIVGGKDIVHDLKMAIDQVQVNLSIHQAASCSFQVVNIYNVTDGTFNNKHKILIAGQQVEVSIGYGSKLVKLFKGYIYSVSKKFEGIPYLFITAMDVRRLMMENETPLTITDNTTYEKIVQNILKQYKTLCSKVITAKPTKREGKITQSGSDNQFITDILCKFAYKEFYILYDTAYFWEPMKNKTPVISLQWGKELLSFSKDEAYKNLILKIYAGQENSKEKKKLMAQEEFKTTPFKQLMRAGIKAQTISFVDSQVALDNAVKYVLLKERMEAEKASASSIGIPELVPARFVKLKRLSEDCNKKYYITEVQHSIGRDGFTTNLSFGGWID